MEWILLVYFFFSSRRRHTRCGRDWNSDVCSSDLDAMLVVADQRAAGIGGERGLAGARQAEEDRSIAVRADVRRAVHRHDAVDGQQIVRSEERRVGKEGRTWWELEY